MNDINGIKKNIRRDIRRITAFTLALVMCAAGFVFAAGSTPSSVSLNVAPAEKLRASGSAAGTAAAVKTRSVSSVSIVSPSDNAISTSDNLLISVKLTQPGTVRVTVYEKMTEEKVIRTKYTEASSQETATPSSVLQSGAAIVSAAAVSGASVSAGAVSQVQSTAAALSAAGPSGVTASAARSVYTTYASFIYHKAVTTSFEAIDFTSGNALAGYVNRVFVSPVIYTSKENIGFYTKQISVSAGIYEVVAEALDEEGNVTETVRSTVVVKEKPVEEETVVFEQKQSGALKLLQNLLKTLFK